VYEIARKVKTQKVVIILGTGAGTPINGHHAAEISPLTAARAMGSEKIRAPLSCCFSVSLIVLTQRSGHSPPDKWRACSSFFFCPVHFGRVHTPETDAQLPRPNLQARASLGHTWAGPRKVRRQRPLIEIGRPYCRQSLARTRPSSSLMLWLVVDDIVGPRK